MPTLPQILSLATVLDELYCAVLFSAMIVLLYGWVWSRVTQILGGNKQNNRTCAFVLTKKYFFLATPS